MNLQRVKMEAIPSDGEPAGAPAQPVEPAQQVDSEEASSFASIDEELFSGIDDFEDMSLGDEPGDEILEKPAATPPPPAPEPIVEQQQPTAMPTVAPSAPEPLEPQPSPHPAPVAPPASPPAPQDKSYEVLRQEAQQELQKRYALSKEDADAMISEPEVVVPKLMSRMYLDVYDNVMRSMQVYLPQMVQQLNSSTTAQQRDESDFYNAWPKLKERSNDVLEIGRRYRALNPTATKEQFIQDVGLHASIALKIPVESPLMQSTVQSAPPAAAQNPPYVPPRGGPVSHSDQKPKPQGMFGELADEWEEQERL